MSASHSWLCGVVVKTPDWKSVGSESKYSNFSFFWEEKNSLISLILNTKSQKHVYINKSDGKSIENLLKVGYPSEESLKCMRN